MTLENQVVAYQKELIRLRYGIARVENFLEKGGWRNSTPSRMVSDLLDAPTLLVVSKPAFRAGDIVKSKDTGQEITVDKGRENCYFPPTWILWQRTELPEEASS